MQNGYGERLGYGARSQKDNAIRIPHACVLRGVCYRMLFNEVMGVPMMGQEKTKPAVTRLVTINEGAAMTARTVKITFHMASPILLRGRLYLDAVLLALATQSGIPYDQAVADLPITQRNGLFRCSQLLWDGLPDTVTVKKQMNIWAPGSLDSYADTVQKGFVKSDRKTYKPLMDDYLAMDLPQTYFLVETQDQDRLLADVQAIPALGKWSRKGCGMVDGVTLEPIDADPWVRPDGRPARALPINMWKMNFGGPCALNMEVVQPPYWDSEKVQLCAVDTLDGVLS